MKNHRLNVIFSVIQPNIVERAGLTRLAINSNEIIGIQCMRFVAALAVLIDHFIISLNESGRLSREWLNFAYRLGDAGVFFFFAISGFVMVLTNRHKFQQPGSPLDFFSRRLIRIWPMYFIATIIVFAMKHGSDNLCNIENLLKSISFVPYIGAKDFYRPILGKGWTLNYEMFFYAVFAVCLFFPKKTGLVLASLVLIALGISSGTEGNVLWKFYANTVVLYFFVGVFVAYLVKETRFRYPHFLNAEASVSCSIGLFAALIAVDSLALPQWVKQCSFLLMTFAGLYCVCFAETRFRNSTFTRFASLLGDSSYCLYLFHGFVFVAVKPILKNISDQYLFAYSICIGVAASILCAFVHLYIEKPLNQFLLKNIKITR